MIAPSSRARKLLWLTAITPALFVVTVGADTCNDKTQMVPMRDGANLATDVYSTKGNGTVPGVIMRTPYGRGGLNTVALTLNDQGYQAIAQDMRGFGESDGQFMYFTDDGFGARQDGYDTVEWAASQEWSNGKFCLWGGSALSIAGLLASASAPPHLSCMYALVGTGNLYHDVTFWGGALREEMVVNWLVGLGQQPALDAIYAHPTEDSFYDPISIQDRYASINIPIYSVGGWYDIFSQGNLDVFTGADTLGGPGANGKQKLLMGPWSHASGGPVVGELTFPDNSVLPGGEELRWFEHWLKGTANGVNTEPAVKYYLMGDVDTPSTAWNIWKTSEVWPVPSTPTPYYLVSGGSISTSAPLTANSETDTFVFDPANPVPTVGGNNLTLLSGPYDQRTVEARPDVLVYSTPPLTAPVAITGRVTAKLWVASSAPDTDFTVKLTDVYPDGRSMLVLDGIQRMRFREGSDREVLMTPGVVYPITVDLWSTALVFNKGHQIRVSISSSNASRFNVNTNTGGPLYMDDAMPQVAEQTLVLDAAHPSQIILPVVGL